MWCYLGPCPSPPCLCWAPRGKPPSSTRVLSLIALCLTFHTVVSSFPSASRCVGPWGQLTTVSPCPPPGEKERQTCGLLEQAGALDAILFTPYLTGLDTETQVLSGSPRVTQL